MLLIIIHFQHWVLQCYIEKNEIGETELFYFSDISMEQSVIKEKIDKLYQSVEE